MIKTILFPLLFILSINSFTVYICRKSFGKSLPLTLMSSTFLMFYSQYFLNTFRYGFYLLIGLGFGGFFLFIYEFIKKDDEFLNNYVSFGLYSLAITYILFTIIDYNRVLSAHDEVSHWGMMVKEMYRIDKFYTDPSSYLLPHRDYPPMISIFELLWCYLGGSYSETGISMAIHVLSMSFLLSTLFEKKQEFKKEIFNAVIFLFLYMLIIFTFDVYGIFLTTYTDFIMPFIYVYLMMLVIKKDVFNDWFGFIAFTVGLSFLMLSKQMSIAFVLLAWSYFALMLVFNKDISSLFNTLSKKCFVIVITLTLSFLHYFMWSTYVKQYFTGGQFDLGKISLSSLVDIFNGGGTPVQQETTTLFLNGLLTKNLFVGIIPISYVGLCIIAIVLLVAIYIVFKKEWKKKHYIILGCVFIYGSICYAFAMYALYMFCFSNAEMLSLASFERYMDSYVITEFLILLGLFLYLTEEHKPEWLSYKNILVGVLLSCIILDHSKYKQFLPQRQFQGDGMVYYGNVGTYIHNHTEPGSKIFLIARSIGEHQFAIQYFTTERHIHYGYNDIFDITDKNEIENIRDIVKNCDYVYVFEANENISYNIFNLSYGNEFKNESLYKVVNNEDGLSFELVYD